MRPARRTSSSSRSNARDTVIVSSASPSAVVNACAVDDVRAGRSAGAGDDGQKAWMVRRDDRDFRRVPRGIRPDVDERQDACPVARRLEQQVDVPQPVRLVDLEPIGVAEPVRIGFEGRARQMGQGLLQLGPGDVDAPSRVVFGAARGQHALGLPIQGPQQLAFPIVPDAGADRADVADRQDEQQPQPLDRLHERRKRLDRPPVAEVAPLCGVGHDEMVFDQPDDDVRLGRRELKARAELARHLHAGQRMVFDATLGDVVQEQRDEERAPLGDRRDDLVDERMLVAVAPRLELREIADRQQEVLVDGVMVVHVGIASARRCGRNPG